jgi:hypothetical protein
VLSVAVEVPGSFVVAAPAVPVVVRGDVAVWAPVGWELESVVLTGNTRSVLVGCVESVPVPVVAPPTGGGVVVVGVVVPSCVV